LVVPLWKFCDVLFLYYLFFLEIVSSVSYIVQLISINLVWIV